MSVIRERLAIGLGWLAARLRGDGDDPATPALQGPTGDHDAADDFLFILGGEGE